RPICGDGGRRIRGAVFEYFASSGKRDAAGFGELASGVGIGGARNSENPLFFDRMGGSESSVGSGSDAGAGGAGGGAGTFDGAFGGVWGRRGSCAVVVGSGGAAYGAGGGETVSCERIGGNDSPAAAADAFGRNSVGKTRG